MHHIKEVLILDDAAVVKQYLVLKYVFEEMATAFSDWGLPVRNIYSIKELHDNAIVLCGDDFKIENPAEEFAKYAPNAIYCLWYWHEKSVIALKNVIHLYGDSKNPDHRMPILKQHKYNCPLLLRASEEPSKVGTYSRNVTRDYFFSGWMYKPDWVPPSSSDLTGIYHGKLNHLEFLDYNTRRTLYLSSHFALGFQSDQSVFDETVSQRIYEGMAYGCIVLTNSDASVRQTNNIAVKVNSLEDVIEKMKWFKEHPDEMECIRQKGYEFIKLYGTNRNAVRVIIDEVNKIVSNKTTVVTAYYPLEETNHLHSEYREWYTNFFECVSADVVCFCPPELKPEFDALAKQNHTIIPRTFDSFEMMSPKYMQIWNELYAHDIERWHRPELYAIWAAKQEFVREAMKLVDSSTYVWCDIGCFRTKRTADFSITSKYIVPRKITCLYLKDVEHPTGRSDTIGGGVLAGDKDAWANFSRQYLESLNQDPHGKDQVVYMRILNESNANFIHPNSDFKFDKWFYLTYMFSTAMKEAYIGCKLKGGLANNLFQVAFTDYIAHHTGRKQYVAYNKSCHSDINYLTTIFKNIQFVEAPPDVRQDWVFEDEKFTVPEDWLSIITTPNVMMNGYFQDYNYILPSFKDKLSFDTSKYPNISQKVFLHIRGGDYVNHWLHYVDLRHYYKRAVNLFEPDTEFAVFTNDVSYANDILSKLNIRHTILNENEIDSLYLMSQCKGGICANSSFSWWGAYLNLNRKLILPSKWLTDPAYYTAGLYFPGCTIVDVQDTSNKVVYINLDSRPDRRQHMERITARLGADVIRFPAIATTPGWIGCAMSHIAVLQMAIHNNWKNVLILEDDADWNQYDQGYKKLVQLMNKPYDVIMLGAAFSTIDPQTSRITSGSTTTAYLVNNHYFKTLASNFAQALQKLIETGDKGTYSIDQWWKQLQARDNWYCVNPCLALPLAGHSDIDNQFSDQRAHFNT